MSTNHFNQLTEAEAERPAILAEECGEVIQVVGKILRHGYESFSPYDSTKTTNRELLQVELGDVMAINKVIAEFNDVDRDVVVDNMTEKYRKIMIQKSFIHHQ